MPEETEPSRTRISASKLDTWMKCPLQAKFRYVDKLPSKRNAAATFGTCIHHALERYNQTRDMDLAISEFIRTWENPSTLKASFETWPKGTSFGGYRARGIGIVRAYADQEKWEKRDVLATEHSFSVPFAEFDLVGFVDCLEVRRNGRGASVLRIIDYKTNKKQPTRSTLPLNIQFTVYWYASMQPEFWLGNGPEYPAMDNGAHWWQFCHDMPRSAIWYHLENQKELDCGTRSDPDFVRMLRACRAIKRAMDNEVYVPNISGESCLFCDYIEPCGQRPVQQDPEDEPTWL